MTGVVGDYELERQIGAGSSGTVWRAHRRGPVNQVVALKRLRASGDPLDLDRIRHEATVLTELDHPHIVRVVEVVEDGDSIAVAMHLAAGGSLQAVLADRGALPPGEVVAVVAPIADALASAHRRTVVHGDVKPANILFTSDGEPLLGDFGVARTLGQVGPVAGTAEYLAPESFGGAPPDPRGDVYALGVVCYEALTGRPPYGGASPEEVVQAAGAGFHEPLSRWPAVPPALAEVVERAMARHPDQRFASADEFAQALRSTVPPFEVRLPGPAQSAVELLGEDDGSRGTRTFGPRPPEREKPSDKQFWRPTMVGGLAFLAVALFLIFGPLREDAEPECPDEDRPAPVPGVQVVQGDPAGNGCQVYGTYGMQQLGDGSEVMILDIEFEDDPDDEHVIGIGDPGDQVFLGDWDCDQIDTPGIYRRASGQVDYFYVWPEREDARYAADLTEPVAAGGIASLQVARDAGEGRCDRIVVTP